MSKNKTIFDNKVSMNCIDLFSGCGGLTLGLHNAGISGVFAVEKNVDAFKTLKFNMITRCKHFDWPQWLPQKAHDINELLDQYSDELLSYRGQIDLLAGGPPCQGFSLAGRRKKTDKRNKLVDSYIRMVKIIHPTFILLENVKGFTIPFVASNGSSKQYSSDVVQKLERLGYDVSFKLINFSSFGVPQHRTRFILFGINKSLVSLPNISQLFFTLLDEKKQDFLKEKGLADFVCARDAINDLLQANGTIQSDDFPQFHFGCYSEEESNFQKLMRRDNKNIYPDSHRFARHGKEIENRFRIAINEQLSSSEYRSRFNLKKSSTKCLAPDKPTPTLTTLPDDYIHYSEPRILTVREYARIQSFPDDFIFCGKYTTGGRRRLQEVPRYSQIGNAIPPLFGEIAGKVLLEIASKLQRNEL